VKTTAYRLIVLAASVIAAGTSAFAQTRMTVQVPFEFKTVAGTLPAGTYEFSNASSASLRNSVALRNTATDKAVFAGNAIFNSNKAVADAPVVEFACGAKGCALKAIRTRDGSNEYQVPHSKDHEKVAVISVPMKPLSAD